MADEINVESIYKSGDVKNFGAVSGKDLLGFAKYILFYLFLIVMFVFSMSYFMARWDGENQELAKVVGLILNITQTAVPSIVSLVLGFYFGKREQVSNESSSGS